MSHRAPVRGADAETDKRLALRLAGSAAQREDVAESSRDNAIRFAAESGASVSEIAGATGLDEVAVERIVSRVAD
jgi:hypothetical protein